jgi:hypothetical protein
MSRSGATALRLTKIDVAEAHLITAVRANFRGEHPASVYLLAASAREILTTLGEKTGTRTMLAGVAETTGTPLKTLVGIAGEFANFFKHANRDPAAKLEDFTEHHADMVLYIACHDFFRIAKGLAIELQVFEAWYFAIAFPQVSKAPLRVQPHVRRCIKLFPGIRAAATRAEQQRIGLAQLEKARDNPKFKMEIQRNVVLPGDSEKK